MDEENKAPSNEFMQEFMAASSAANDNQAKQKAPKPPREHNTGSLIRKVVIGFVVVFAISLIAVISLAVRPKEEAMIGGSSNLTILVSPVKAKIVINGKEYSNGTHVVPAGKCHAVISYDGFLPKEMNFEIGNSGSLVAQYLEPDTGEYSEEDLDLLRFLTKKEELASKIDEYMLTKGLDYQFPSMKKSIFSKYTRVLDKKYSDYADKIVRETLSAFYYYGHPEIKALGEVKYYDTGEIDIPSNDKKQPTYSVYFSDTYANGEGKIEIPHVYIGEYGREYTMFEYDGSYTLDESFIQPIEDREDFDWHEDDEDPLADDFTDE